MFAKIPANVTVRRPTARYADATNGHDIFFEKGINWAPVFPLMSRRNAARVDPRDENVILHRDLATAPNRDERGGWCRDAMSSAGLLSAATLRLMA